VQNHTVEILSDLAEVSEWHRADVEGVVRNFNPLYCSALILQCRKMDGHSDLAEVIPIIV